MDLGVEGVSPQMFCVTNFPEMKNPFVGIVGPKLCSRHPCLAHMGPLVQKAPKEEAKDRGLARALAKDSMEIKEFKVQNYLPSKPS